METLVKLPVAVFTGLVFLGFSAVIIGIYSAWFLVVFIGGVALSPLLALSDDVDMRSLPRYQSGVVSGCGDLLGNLWSRWAQMFGN